MAPRARSRVAAAVVEACTARLAYKAAALFFAVALWIVASGGEPVARLVDVRFEPVLDADVRLLGEPPRVRALVVGPARDLMKLYTSRPVMRRSFGESPPETVRVDLRPVDIDMPNGVGAVVVRDVRPRSFTLHFETLATRRVPVRVAVRAADGTLPPESGFVVEPDTVLVRGPQRVVRGLAELSTVARVIGPGEALGDVPLDTAALGVRATPSRVRLLVRTRTPPAAAGSIPARGDSVMPRDSAAHVRGGPPSSDSLQPPATP